jgi:hypothetical protein
MWQQWQSLQACKQISIKSGVAGNSADLDKLDSLAAAVDVEVTSRHLVGLDWSPATDNRFETWRFPLPSTNSNAT